MMHLALLDVWGTAGVFPIQRETRVATRTQVVLVWVVATTHTVVELLILNIYGLVVAVSLSHVRVGAASIGMRDIVRLRDHALCV